MNYNLNLNITDFSELEKNIITEYWEILKQEGLEDSLLNNLRFDHINGIYKDFTISDDIITYSERKYLYNGFEAISINVIGSQIINTLTGEGLKRFINEQFSKKENILKNEQIFNEKVKDLKMVLEENGYEYFPIELPNYHRRLRFRKEEIGGNKIFISDFALMRISCEYESDTIKQEDFLEFDNFKDMSSEETFEILNNFRSLNATSIDKGFF